MARPRGYVVDRIERNMDAIVKLDEEAARYQRYLTAIRLHRRLLVRENELLSQRRGCVA